MDKALEAGTDGATEERILEAAHRVFVRRGTAGARTQEIADEAGVNKALLHYYFRSKDRLAEAVFLRSARMLFPRMFKIFASEMPLRAKLQEAIDTELALLAEHPFLPGYVLSELQYRPDRLPRLLDQVGISDVQREAVLSGLRASIEAEVEAGRMRSVRPEEVILALMGLIIFPHVALPMVKAVLGLSEDQTAALLDWRAEHGADFIMKGFSA